MSDFEVHPVGTGDRLAAIDAGGCAPRILVGDVVTHDVDRWQARALRAESKLAEIGRLLDDYRDKARPLPTYAELVRLLQG